MKQTFKDDLKRGEKVELDVLKIIQKKYPNAYKIEGYCKEYDLYVPDVGGIEVKYDKKSKETGNIVIEIEMFGKPSALMTTKAYRWIIYDGQNYISFKPDKIKKCINDNNLKYEEFIGKGDKDYKKAYLIKKDMLYKYGVKING